MFNENDMQHIKSIFKGLGENFRQFLWNEIKKIHPTGLEILGEFSDFMWKCLCKELTNIVSETNTPVWNWYAQECSIWSILKASKFGLTAHSSEQVHHFLHFLICNALVGSHCQHFYATLTLIIIWRGWADVKFHQMKIYHSAQLVCY